MTSEAIKVNPNLNGLKLSRARFLRLIAFHQNFFQQMLPDENGMISILNILFIDLELLISTFEVTFKAHSQGPTKILGGFGEPELSFEYDSKITIWN